MAGYPYYSPPPPSPPFNDTTPTLPPPPPPPACNHTTTPTLPPPHPTACACNKTSPTLPPPASPSPPPPHSSYYSPPLASLPSPPPPPSTRYSPPLHSPPPSSHPPPASPPPPPFYYSPPPLPPSSSDYSPPPPSQSPPKPSKALPPPLLQPTKPPPAPSPYYSPQTPLHPPLAPNPPICHCVCPSPWATPPNYYPSIAPSPQFLSPSNGQRTVVLTTFVSLGGVFFLAFITIGLLSMAIRKRVPSKPTMGQPNNSHGRAQTIQSIAASTSAAHSVIDIDRYQKPGPPNQGTDQLVKGETLQQTMPTEPPSNQSMTDKTCAAPEVDQKPYEDVKTLDGEVVEQESIRDESNECNHKPFSEQSEPNNADAGQDVRQGSNAIQEESNNSKARLPKKNPLNRRKGQKGKKKPSKLGQTVKAMCLRGYYQNDDDDDDEEEEEEYESNVNEEEKDERNGKPHGNQSETQSTSTVRYVQKESSTVEEESNVSKERLHPDDKNPSSGHKGKKLMIQSLADDDEKDENDDPVNECNDPSMEGESFVDDNAKKEESKSFGSKKISHLQKRQTGAQRRKEPPDVGQTSTAPIGGDVGVYLKSLADDYEKEENEDPSIECDDPNMEYERQIGARGRRDPPNVGQIWSDPLGGDPSTCFQPLADDDEKEEKEDQGMEFESLVDDGAKEEESESFGLKKVTSLQKRQIGGGGRKGPPNVGKILNIPTGSDAGVDLKFLADDDEKEEKKDAGKEWKSLVDVDDKQKELELFGRKEVTRLHKGQTGAGGRKQPPNLGQIWTAATTGSDPGVDLNSTATQVWTSNIGESMTVRNDDVAFGKLESHDDDGEGDLSGTTNEGDQNADTEFHEEDPELESECSNKGLGLHKPHALSPGETEPSTDDQSVFVTGADDPDESGKVARRGKPLSHPRTTGVRGKRRT